MQAASMWETALRLYQSGDLAGAERACRVVLAQNSDAADALILLAVLCCRQNRLEEGIDACLKALAVRPEDPEALEILGDALDALGEWQGAAEAFRRAAAARPSLWSLPAKQAAALQRCEQLEAAADAYGRAVELGAPQDIRTACAGLHLLLADRCAGDHRQAVEHYRIAARLDPDKDGNQHELGLALQALGNYAEAAEAFAAVVALRPHDPVGYTNLGKALRAAGRRKEAFNAFSQALALRPGFAEAQLGHGHMLGEQWSLEAAIASMREGLRHNPDRVEFYIGLSSYCGRLGLAHEADAIIADVIAKFPDRWTMRSNRLYGMLNIPEVSPAEVLAQSRVYGRTLSANRQPFTTWSCDPAPRRLRVGLVSGDLRTHPVGYFLAAVLGELDPAQVEVIAYPTTAGTDALTERLRGYMAAWTPLVGLDDETAARRIHDDGVHVLLDLSGHTAGNRLPVFGNRPAPVQASWLGYVGTTGVEQMDYLLGDPQVTPVGEEDQCSETPWRLPETYLCYSRPDDAPPVAPLPALATGTVTFGSFTVYNKLTDPVVACWARVLDAVPNSRLLVRNPLMDQPLMRERMVTRLAAHGVAADRLSFEGRTPRAAMWAAYNRVDMILDTFPYPGITTSFEALWMGVPVLSLRGDRFLSHISETIAVNAGQADWIARDEDEYVAKAVAFTADLGALATLRAGLRSRVDASPLFDAPRFARHLEQALWGMWRQRGCVRLAGCV